MDWCPNCERLEEIIFQMQGAINRLEDQVSELSKNSSNSSKPPSSDITKPPHQQRKPGTRKPGGQPGHKGADQKLLPPEEVDHFHELEMDECPSCGNQNLARLPNNPIRQQVYELPEKPCEVHEYRQYAFWCPGCLKVHYAPLPEGVIPGQKLGPHFQAMMTFMKGEFAASFTMLQHFCLDVLGVMISRGSLCNTMQRAGSAMDTPYWELGNHLRNEPVLNIDETGWREKGRKMWLWTFATKEMSFFAVSPSRGSRVLRYYLGKGYPGIIISDFFSAYISYNALLQFCLAHLIRDVKYLTTLTGLLTKAIGEAMLACFTKIFDAWHQKSELNSRQFDWRMTRARNLLLGVVEDIPDTVHAKCLNLKTRILKHQDEIFRFMRDPDRLEPTNNLAEQSLRHPVIARKISQGSRCVWGRRFAAKIYTARATCLKQGRSLFKFLDECTRGLYFGETVPTLLPAG